MASEMPPSGSPADTLPPDDVEALLRLVRTHADFATRRSRLLQESVAGTGSVKALLDGLALVDEERARVARSRAQLDTASHPRTIEALKLMERSLAALKTDLGALSQLFGPFLAAGTPTPDAPSAEAGPDRTPPPPPVIPDGIRRPWSRPGPQPGSAGRAPPPPPAEPVLQAAASLNDLVESLDRTLTAQASRMYLGIRNALSRGGTAAALREKDIVSYHIDGWNNEIIRLRFEVGALNADAAVIARLIDRLDAVEKRWSEQAKALLQLSFSEPPPGADPAADLRRMRAAEPGDVREDMLRMQAIIDEHNHRMSELTLRHADDLRRSRAHWRG